MSIYSILALAEEIGYSHNDLPIYGEVSIYLNNDDMIDFKDVGEYVVVVYTARGKKIRGGFEFIKNIRIEVLNPTQVKRVRKFMEKIS